MRIALLGLLAACGSVGGKPDATVSHDTPIDTPSDAMRDASTCVPRPSTLIAEWRGEMNANDSLANHYNGTPVGNVTYTAGKHGSAFLLDGTSAYVTIDDGDALWPADSFSLEAWVNTTHPGGTLLEKYQCWNFCPNGSATGLWDIGLSSGGSAAFDLRSDTSQTIASVTDSLHQIADGQWHQLVGVRDAAASKLLLYVDGALAVTANLDTANDGTISNTDGETDLIAVGSSPTAGAATFTPNFNGAADELAYYNGALSATEVMAHYTAPDGICP